MRGAVYARAPQDPGRVVRGSMRTMPHANTPPSQLPRWQRALWLSAGAGCMLAGIVGIFLPLLPTTPFVLLAAWCFSRGSVRWEHWLLGHPRFGPMVRDWRANRAVPLRAKQVATLSMVLGSAWGWWAMPPRISWLPAVWCSLVALWLWRLPNAAPRR